MTGLEMSKIKILLILCMGFLLLAGCAKQQRYETVEQICVPNLEKADAMQAAEDVLGRMHFTIAKLDAERGYIRSRPLSGGQFFEFWRQDNVGAFASAEASLHSIRRIVELDISQQEGQMCIDCDVKTQRLSLSERKGSDLSLKYDKFADRDIRVSSPKLELGAEQKAWVDLGLDDKLATVILKRIEAKIAKQQKGKSQ